MSSVWSSEFAKASNFARHAVTHWLRTGLRKLAMYCKLSSQRADLGPTIPGQPWHLSRTGIEWPASDVYSLWVWFRSSRIYDRDRINEEGQGRQHCLRRMWEPKQPEALLRWAHATCVLSLLAECTDMNSPDSCQCTLDAQKPPMR